MRIQDEVLTVAEAAVMLKVSRHTVWRALKRKQIPAKKVGRQWRLSRQAILNWLSEHDEITIPAVNGGHAENIESMN